MPNKTTRQKIQELQTEMQAEQRTAMESLRDILNRKAIVDAMVDIRALRENVSPNSSEEQWIDTFVQLHAGVLTNLDQKYPKATPPIIAPLAS